MMIVNNNLYTFSSDNFIRYSEIPIYDDPNLYNQKLRNEYYLQKGNISIFGNKIIINSKNTIVISKNFNAIINNTFYTHVTPNDNYDCSLIFGLDRLNESLFSKENYFMLIINRNGYIILSKIFKGIYSEIIKKKSAEIYDKFDKRNTYKITIKYIPYIGTIIASVNDNIIFNIIDNSFNGRYAGFTSLGKGTVFSQIMLE